MDDFKDIYGDEVDETEEYLHDKRVDEAELRIIKIVEENKVVTDRELKVRLEKDFFPWVVSRGLKNLIPSKVREVGYPGRRVSGGTESFYVLVDTSYDDVQDLIKIKRRIANMVADVLTGVSDVSRFAEDLFEDAFSKLGFMMHGRDVSSFKGKNASGIKGKEPPNLDFVVEKDGLIYGVDVKNWIRYEYNSRQDIEQKVTVALALDVIPWIIARYVDKDMIYTNIYSKGGVAYPYISLLLPPNLRSLAEDANRYLGYPVLAVDSLPDYKVKWMEKLHQLRLKSKRL